MLTGVDQHNSHDLLPLPYNEQTIAHIVDRIKQVPSYQSAKQKDGKMYRISGRVFVIGRRVYQTTVITEVENFDAKIAVKFFKSFKLVAP